MIDKTLTTWQKVLLTAAYFFKYDLYVGGLLFVIATILFSCALNSVFFQTNHVDFLMGIICWIFFGVTTVLELFLLVMILFVRKNNRIIKVKRNNGELLFKINKDGQVVAVGQFLVYLNEGDKIYPIKFFDSDNDNSELLLRNAFCGRLRHLFSHKEEITYLNPKSEEPDITLNFRWEWVLSGKVAWQEIYDKLKITDCHYLITYLCADIFRVMDNNREFIRESVQRYFDEKIDVPQLEMELTWKLIFSKADLSNVKLFDYFIQG